MTRAVLSDTQVHPAVRQLIASHGASTVQAVQAAVAQHAVVVVGMAQNPYPRRARKALAAAGVPFHYMEFGSYVSQWRQRTALKMWCGWPTLPMIFVKGNLVGGYDDLAALIASGELKRLLT
jgi:monothiol glutaredoxin